MRLVVAASCCRYLGRLDKKLARWPWALGSSRHFFATFHVGKRQFGVLIVSVGYEYGETTTSTPLSKGVRSGNEERLLLCLWVMSLLLLEVLFPV